jgi:hypothetical protein
MHEVRGDISRFDPRDAYQERPSIWACCHQSAEQGLIGNNLLTLDCV